MLQNDLKFRARKLIEPPTKEKIIPCMNMFTLQSVIPMFRIFFSRVEIHNIFLIEKSFSN